MVVKGVLHGDIGHHHVARGGMQHALRLARAARGVKHEEWGLALHPLALARLREGACEVLQPDVPAVDPGVLALVRVARALQPRAGHHGLHLEALLLGELACLVGDALELHRLGAAHDAVGGDDHFGGGVHDAARQRLRGEAAEDHGVHGADAVAREHRHGQVHSHRQVDRDAFALGDAGCPHRIGQLADLCVHLLVGVGPVRVVDVVALVIEGHAVAEAGLDIPVEAVVGDICLASGEPLDGDRALGTGEVEGRADLRKGRLPVERLSHVAPELLGVLNARLPHGLILLHRLHMSVGLELRRRGVDLRLIYGLIKIAHGRRCGGTEPAPQRSSSNY
mmetsp:Transcript_90854/g.234590  ORF Transcript_90854/g.234590 Transcript_90854/m.234590 type:complete len:337 (-) Transcript_90854:13-1023(-)